MGASSTQRSYDFPVADADNHLYERRDAFTRYLPPGYEDLVRFIEIDGKQQLVIKGKLAFILPNPTLEKVPPPGAYGDGDPMGTAGKPRIVQSPPEFFEPEPRLKWMRETGIDRAICFPTLGLSVEERLQKDTEARHVLIHAFNQWLLEQWTFNYENAIFATPLITLSILDKALAELEWVLENGAKAIYVQLGFVTTDRGYKSMALPEFDPFWKRVEESGVLVTMHSGDGGQNRYINEWEGTPDEETEHFKKGRSKGSMAFRAFVGQYDRITGDVIASMLCHGLFNRFPKLNIMPAETLTYWVRPTLARMEQIYRTQRQLFDANPIEQFKTNVKVHLFHDPDPVGLIREIGAETCVFGSDFPHPEGRSNPLDFAAALEGLTEAEVALVMGGNLDRMLGITAGASA